MTHPIDEAVVLKPGWLKADMERASVRCALWKAEGTMPTVPSFNSTRSTLKDKQK